MKYGIIIIILNKVNKLIKEWTEWFLPQHNTNCYRLLSEKERHSFDGFFKKKKNLVQPFLCKKYVLTVQRLTNNDSISLVLNHILYVYSTYLSYFVQSPRSLYYSHKSYFFFLQYKLLRWFNVRSVDAFSSLPIFVMVPTRYFSFYAMQKVGSC